MKKKITAFLVLIVFGLSTRAQDEKIAIVHARLEIQAGSCSYRLAFDTIKLTDKGVESKINAEIKKEKDKYRLEPSKARDYCLDKIDYEQEAQVQWSKNNIISLFLGSSVYAVGSRDTVIRFSTLNFDAKTGDHISLHDLFAPNMSGKVDSFLMRKFRTEYDTAMVQNLHYDFYSRQLANADFNFFKKGIEIIFHGENYLRPMLDIYIPFTELEPYLKQESPLLKYCAR